MTQETAPMVALRALMNADGPQERQVARRMGEAVLAGRGFVIWRVRKDISAMARGRIVDAFADREACEASMARTIWATTEAARGRSLAQACEIHGFEIVEVPPAAPQLVWIVEGEHWSVPGIRHTVHRTEAGANAKAAEIVNALISDAIGPGGCLRQPGAVPEVSFELDQATAENWREVNEVFRREMGNIDLGGEEFEPTDEPPFGVTMICKEVHA